MDKKDRIDKLIEILVLVQMNILREDFKFNPEQTNKFFTLTNKEFLKHIDHFLKNPEQYYQLSDREKSLLQTVTKK